MERTKHDRRIVGVHAVRSAVHQPAAPEAEGVRNASGQMGPWDKDGGLDIPFTSFVVISALAVYMTRRTLAIIVLFFDHTLRLDKQISFSLRWEEVWKRGMGKNKSTKVKGGLWSRWCGTSRMRGYGLCVTDNPGGRLSLSIVGELWWRLLERGLARRKSVWMV